MLQEKKKVHDPMKLEKIYGIYHWLIQALNSLC